MKKIIALVACLFILPVTIFAADCDESEIVKFKTAASKVQAKLVLNYYSKTMHSDDADEDYNVNIPYYTIKLTNLTDDFTYYLANDGIIIWNSSKVPFADGSYSYDLLQGYEEIRTFHLIMSPKKCDMKDLKLNPITIPMMNPYRNLGVCKDAKEFYLCHDFWYQDYSSNNLVNEVTKYKNNQLDKDGKKKVKKTFLQKIGEFIKKYAVAFIVGGVVIVGVVVFFVIRRRIIMKKHFG